MYVFNIKDTIEDNYNLTHSEINEMKMKGTIDYTGSLKSRPVGN